MADKLEFNPGALSIFIGLLLLVVTLFIGFMLIKDGGTSGTGRTCGNVYGIDQPNTPYKLQTMDQYLEEKKNEQLQKDENKDEHKSPSLLCTEAQLDDLNRQAEEKKNGHNSGGITDFKMFTSPTEVKIQFKDLQYADVKAYSFKYYAVFESNKSVSRYLSRTEIVGDRMGGDSDQKQFTWNCKWSKTICDELKETLMYITEIHVTKEFNNKPKQVAVVSAADIDFQAEDNMILVD
eukprot:67805_1